MLDRLLVPLDGSSLSECVLPHAIALAKAFNAQITLVHVLDQPAASFHLPKADPLDWFLKKSAAQMYLDALQSRLEQELHLSVDVILEEGNAADKIVELAHATQANLLILNGYGETGVKRGGVVSSMAQEILQRVRISTLLVRADQTVDPFTHDLRYHRMLIPLDGSQRAGSALALAAAFAEVYHPELLLIHVIRKPEMARHMPLSEEDAELINRVIERNREESIKYLEQAQAHLPANTQTRVLMSENIAATLQMVSQEEQFDLLVLSAHGYSGEAHWPYGSVTNRFITDGTAPLLIVQDLQWDAPVAKRASVETRVPMRMNNGS